MKKAKKEAGRLGVVLDPNTEKLVSDTIHMASVGVLEAVLVNAAQSLDLPAGNKDKLDAAMPAEKGATQFKAMPPNKIKCSDIHPTIWNRALAISRDS